MKTVLQRLLRLFTGLFLYAVGIVLTINASLGLSPWDVFHQGLSNVLGITMGQASIGVGLILVIADSLLGERIGWGTLCNMLFIGLFMDLLMLNGIIPVSKGIVPGLLMASSGMFVIGIASYFYIGAGLGSGPRDGMMVALTKKTGRSVRFIRNAIELCVLVIGYFLGGFVGFGTLFMALAVGYFVQFAFKLFKFNVKSVQHRFIDDDIKLLAVLFSDKKKDINAE